MGKGSFTVQDLKEEGFTWCDGALCQSFEVKEKVLFNKRAMIISRIGSEYKIRTYHHGDSCSIEVLTKDQFKQIIQQMQEMCED